MYLADGIKLKFYEEKTIKRLETTVNEFLTSLYNTGTEILDIQYHSDKEEYGKHFTCMIIYKPTA